MADIRLNKLVSALRAQLGTSTTSIAVSVALASSTAANAADIPLILPEKSLFPVEDASPDRELLFIDADVMDAGQLVMGLKQGVETIILDRNRDGIEQISQALDKYSDISAVHIVAHGEPGLLKLGNTRLDADELNYKAILLRRWFKDIGNDKPDLLLYACDVARGEDGAAFVEQLAVLTGADVAASIDRTGAGGNWDFEYKIGYVDTSLAFKQEDLLAYPHSLATFTVTKTADTADGTCDADCSLREAITAANAAGGADIIAFAPAVTGTITLTTGNIVISDTLEINGPGATALAISGGNTSRIFDIPSSSVTIRDLTLRDGNADGDGGAIRSGSSELRIEDSVITENTASDDGGGIYQDEGDLYIIRSEVSNNYAGDDGGGIFQYVDGDSDYLVVVDSLVNKNEADSDGGGIALYGDYGGTATITSSEISENIAGDDGGGIFLYTDDEGYYTYITDSTISDNMAGDDGGGIFFYTDDDGYLVINNSTISGNNAGGSGGGISFYSDDGALELNNSTVSGNHADNGGGGIHLDEASSGVDIKNSTIVLNDADSRGGGVDNYDQVQLDISNSIIADNTAPDGPDMYVDSSGTSVRYSLIGDTSGAFFSDSGGNILDTSSGVSPTLANAGGPTLVHQLNLGSPAINTAEPGFTEFNFDQRGAGFPRVTDGQMDMGAVEMSFAVGGGGSGPVPVPTLQNWALILLAMLMPGLALNWRRRLEKKQLSN